MNCFKGATSSDPARFCAADRSGRGTGRPGYGRKPEGAKRWHETMLQEVGSQLDPARTHLLGKVPYEDYKRILQVSAAHVYLTCPFVLSGSMLKAMATGCLVIGSDTAPAREVLMDDVDGWLVNACDRRDIVSKALECLDELATTASAIRGEAMKAAHAGYGVQAGVAAFSQLCLGGSISLQEVSRAA